MKNALATFAIARGLNAVISVAQNMEVSFVEEEKGVLIRKKGPHTSPVRQVYGILRKNVSTDKFLEDIRGR